MIKTSTGQYHKYYFQILEYDQIKLLFIVEVQHSRQMLQENKTTFLCRVQGPQMFPSESKSTC